jgi:2,4-dienoyl-CoA reductase-like NADH-dependent reductase (Old Yellow Enzyme family)
LRDDDYGGPVENRIRLLRQVTQAVADTVGADRTAVRLSPNGESQGVNDSDPFILFPPAAAALSEIGIAFLELREPPQDGTFGKAEVDPVHPHIRKAFTGPLVLNSDFTLARAQAALDAGEADAITFGRPFLANPDLVERLRRSAPLNPDVMETWYSQGPEGYIDYPALEGASA